MKLVKFIVAAVLLISAASAWADDAEPAGQQYHVSMLQPKILAGADVKISPADYPNGVFVRVKEMFGERPVSASIFAEKLQKLGFKIAGKAENADAVFLIRSSTINFKEIDQNADGFNARRADVIAGTVGAAIATGGLSLLATDWSAFGDARPIYTDMVVFIENPKHSSSIETSLNGAIKTDAANAKVTRVEFELFSDEWLKEHVIDLAGSRDGSVTSYNTK
ncbi:hypothetical protein GALL_89840 [mine drainage metagenome]|uniref:Uncharacterized protein n=1 Tax=mine drainage metagenome TaxID=410659 RepID=A0A1J5SYA8_9ZZZZ